MDLTNCIVVTVVDITLSRAILTRQCRLEGGARAAKHCSGDTDKLEVQKKRRRAPTLSVPPQNKKGIDVFPGVITNIGPLEGLKTYQRESKSVK